MIQFALLGLALGGLYALASQGLILIYRGSGIVNFAQGAIVGVGAFAFYVLHIEHGMPSAPAVIAALILCGAVGALIHFAVMRPLRYASPLTRVIATLGIMAFLQGIGDIEFSSEEVRTMPSLLPTGTVSILSSPIGVDRILILGIACVVTVSLWIIYRFTKFGLATTAVAENEEVAQLAGRSPSTIALINWVAGCVLAGFAGILLAPISGLLVDTMVILIVPLLAVGVIGGFSSFPAVLGASLVIGIIQSEMTKYVSTPGWSDAVPFLLVTIVLVVRGKALPLRGHINERLPDIGRGWIRPRVFGPVIAVIALVVILQPTSWSLAFTTSFLIATICVSVVIVTGYAGQLSLAQFAFAGFAGFVATRLAATLGVPFFGACVVGVLAAIPLGVLVGAPSLRTRGINLAIVTLGLAFAFQTILFDEPTFAGGANLTIVKPPTIFGWPIDIISHPRRYEFAALLVLLLALVVASNLRRGRAGRRFIAVRSNERAAAALGISVPRAKLFAFAVSAGVAGLAGVLLAFESTYPDYSQFSVFASINVVISSVIGGVGYLLGALVGGVGTNDGVVTRFISSFVSSGQVTEWVDVVLSLLLIVTLIQCQDGIVGFMIRRRRKGSDVMSARELGTEEVVEPKRTAEIVNGSGVLTNALTTNRLPAISHEHLRVTPRQLVVEDLRVCFGSVVAVDGITLTVEPGSVVGLMGPNGAGKTTLIDAVTGFVSINSGNIRLDEVRINGMSATKRASLGISRSFQSLELFEEVSVGENVRVAVEAPQRYAYVRDLFWPRNEELSAAGQAAINVLGLTKDIGRRPGELPFGRRRLVAIARAIASEPSVLLLDEPAAGLDERETEELSVLIRTLADDWGFAVLLVEHDVPLLMRTCDQLVAIDFGRPVASGTPNEVRVHPDVIASYLGEETHQETVMESKDGVPG